MQQTLARSVVVGAVATLVDLLSLVVLVQLLEVPPEVANVPALVVGVAVQFVGNKWFAFRDPSIVEASRSGALATSRSAAPRSRSPAAARHRPPARNAWRRLPAQTAQFALVEAGALALNALGFHLLVTATPTPYPLARAIASAAVYLGYSYPLWGRIFGERE